MIAGASFAQTIAHDLSPRKGRAADQNLGRAALSCRKAVLKNRGT